jgi:hypothetical protein
MVQAPAQEAARVGAQAARAANAIRRGVEHGLRFR